MKKNWVFGVSDFIGNPKWLYLYLKERHPELSINWIADSEEKVKEIKESNAIVTVYSRESLKGKNLLSAAEVYVEEQFREFYPEELPEACIYLNLWHGVGLKNIERKAPFNGTLAKNIMTKNIKYFNNYYCKTLFLVTSEQMETHFSENITTPNSNFIKGDYPRVTVPKLLKKDNYQLKKQDRLKSANKVIMFAPTYRDTNPNGTFLSLLPNFKELKTVLEEQNSIMIINLHPRMRIAPSYLSIFEEYKNDDHFLFIENTDDIYEYFEYIDYTIIDYSSIFYDLMAAGSGKFIRYIPDIEEYTTYQPNMIDYQDKTYGPIVKDFEDLLKMIKKNNESEFKDENKYTKLMDYFFNYSTFDSESIEKMISEVANFQPNEQINLRELHSFDIFDTLIDRNTTRPIGIFSKIQEEIVDNKELDFPRYLKKEYERIRMQAENAVRFSKRRTKIERVSDVVEVTFDEIIEQISFVYNLTVEQCDWLKETEIQAEIDSVRPIQSRIDEFIKLSNEGHHVIMISDMYLPREVILKMIEKADPRLLEFKLYLSSETGYQKSTGLLYHYVYFGMNEKFKKWVHYGDNEHADKVVPERYGITSVHHSFLNFNTYESKLVSYVDSYDAYQVANLMRDFRAKNNIIMDQFSKEQGTQYYAYAYISLYLVSYVYWTLKSSIDNGNEVVYFVTRDGNVLKPIADKIIKEKNWKLKTKLIYGSRKSWRIPGIDLNEQGKVSDIVFSGFGLFQTPFESFEKLLKTAELEEDQFIEFFPSLKEYKVKEKITLQEVINFRNTAKQSEEYKDHLLSISKKQLKLATKYFQQEINPSESFSIVEFWGRGYTQNSFRNILRRAFNDDSLSTEFYYARSIYKNEEGSIRHNLTNSAKDLTFIEYIFNTVPMKTVTGYQEEGGRIFPMFAEQHSDFYAYFEQYTLEFASNFAELKFYDEKSVISGVFDFSIDYFEKNMRDQLIVDNFSHLSDNIAIGGNNEVYAPEFSAIKILTTKVTTLKKMTNSLPMSIEKSSKMTQLAFSFRQKSSKIIRIILDKK